jgi:hypothetical protein
MHVYRWDLDRTYLATEISSVRGLVRAALETADQKRNIPGAPALLRSLIEHDPSCRVAIVSGSPPQMRQVLEEKLALDGVRFDQLVLKDSLSSLRRGRVRAVTGQMGYKLPKLLQMRAGLGHVVRETLFGDDSEVDALVYAVYADVIAGRLAEPEMTRIMEAGGAYPEAIEEACRALQRVGRADAVEDAFILLERGNRALARFHLLGSHVVPVYSWFQAAVLLWVRGRLTPSGVAGVARAVSDEGTSEHGLAGLVQDLVRRGLVSADDIERLLAEAPGLGPIATPIRRALLRMGPIPEAPRRLARSEYVAFLRAEN